MQNVYLLPVSPVVEQFHLPPRPAERHRAAVSGGPVLDDVDEGDVRGSAGLGLNVYHEGGLLRPEVSLVFCELEVAARHSTLALGFAD